MLPRLLRAAALLSCTGYLELLGSVASRMQIAVFLSDLLHVFPAYAVHMVRMPGDCQVCPLPETSEDPTYVLGWKCSCPPIDGRSSRKKHHLHGLYDWGVIPEFALRWKGCQGLQGKKKNERLVILHTALIG